MVIEHDASPVIACLQCADVIANYACVSMCIRLCVCVSLWATHTQPIHVQMCGGSCRVYA